MAEASNKFDYTKLNTLAVVALASAVTLFGAPAAVISGHISLAQLKDSNEKGRWMAITGLVVGYFGIAVGLVATVVNIVLRVRHGAGFMDDHQMRMNPPIRVCDQGPMHGGFNDCVNPYPIDPMPDSTVTPMPGTN